MLKRKLYIYIKSAIYILSADRDQRKEKRINRNVHRRFFSSRKFIRTFFLNNNAVPSYVIREKAEHE